MKARPTLDVSAASDAALRRAAARGGKGSRLAARELEARAEKRSRAAKKGWETRAAKKRSAASQRGWETRRAREPMKKARTAGQTKRTKAELAELKAELKEVRKGERAKKRERAADERFEQELAAATAAREAGIIPEEKRQRMRDVILHGDRRQKAIVRREIVRAAGKDLARRPELFAQWVHEHLDVGWDESFSFVYGY